MNRAAHAVREARPGEAAALAQVLARAFERDAFTRFMYPDPARRARRLAPNFERPLRVHRVWTTQDHAGVASWMPPGSRPGSRLPLILALMRDVGIPHAFRVMEAFGEVSRHHPRHPPHWYLALLGVDPQRQREGIGTALLRPVLDRCDAERTPAWLETATEANVAFYERLGFAVDAEFPVAGVTFWGMLRTPR